MAWLRELMVRLGWSGGLDSFERDVDEEIRFHLEMRALAERAGGLDDAEARDAARRRFGDARRIRREGARILAGAPPGGGSGTPVDTLALDVVLGMRRLARNPGATLLTAGVLALGLAVGTSIFTYVNGFSQPFPGVEGDGLIQVFNRTSSDPYADLSYPDFLDLEEATGDVIAGVAGNRSGFAASVRHETHTEVVFGQAVTGRFFSLLDVEMGLGRGLTPEDNLPGAPPAVVISRSWWARSWGSDPEALGSTVYLNNNPYTIVGVTGPRFLGSDASLRPDVWMPFEQYRIVYWAGSPVATMRDVPVVQAHVRFGDGVSEDQGRSALGALAGALDATAPLEEGARSFHAAPATWIHPSARESEAPRNRLLLLTAGGLLLLACANVANLLLAAATGRNREMALRAAQGASPGRLFQQLLTESVLFSLLAGGLALALAGPASARIGSYFARPSVWGAHVPREVSVDLKVFWFAVALSVIAGLTTGLLPALRGSRRDLVEALRDSGGPRTSTGTDGFKLRRAPGVRDVLVTVQVALAVVLLVTSGLVLRTLQSVRDIDAGFDTEHVVASFMSTSSTPVPPEGRELFYRELAERFTALPWVRSATVAAQAPLSPHPSSELRFGDGVETHTTTVAQVVPNYFETLGIGVVRGRGFTAADTLGRPAVAVVNERLAQRHFQGVDPVGQSVWWPSDGTEADSAIEIVGVVSDAKEVDLLADHEPVIYLAYPQQYYTPGNALLLATTIEPRAAIPLLEQELRAVSTQLALVNALPYRDVEDGFAYAQRMNAELFSVVALLGLALAAAGVFGVLSLAVGQRTREIGIRLAIGATRAHIVRAVVGRVMVALALGIVGGLVASRMASSLVEGLLLGTGPRDPLALAGGVAVLVVAAAAAVWLPVRRALRVDPMASLKIE